ncbi:helix-turn-helix transcriptional regulator [Paraneptunicella aestuarii]|uniref:helix-turn-helix transcriptional regulator n=1 Tax=Paraneptunicella aestuarii TaxID=2831148 RepID=UPI001E47C985|nr:helix-turn-helix transcriptional regulator [Paraneptunicella aestuarii]UAA37724.1 helix-turn-helix transcriptional regulator [Paraneptunicella aestuarii]
MRQIKGSDLRAMRQFAGLTTLQMATAAGVKTRKTYENWEKEVGFPSVNQFFLMVSACGFDIDTYIRFMDLRDSSMAA